MLDDDATSKSADLDDVTLATSKSVDVSSKSADATSKSADATSKSADATSKSADATSKSADATSKSADVSSYKGHKDACSCIVVDEHYVLSGGRDRVVTVRARVSAIYSADGWPVLHTLRHLLEVTCLGYLKLRIISGCADGRVRVWSILTGDCMRMFRGDSACNSVRALQYFDHRYLCVHTTAAVKVLDFTVIKDRCV